VPSRANASLLFHPTPDAVYGFSRARRIASVTSAHQRIDVWETPQLGVLVTLDGRPMTSAGDEFVYHECMVHPAALAHPEPRKALVLGGGDGGAAHQLLKHPSIERIVVAELDAELVELARRHLAAVHCGALDDARVELVFVDAARFVATTREQFDLVIVDLTPADTSATELHAPAFYARLKAALSPRAALALHLGSPHFHPDRTAALLAGLRESFALVEVMSAFVPSYGSLWLMALASDTLDAAALFKHDVEERLAARHIDGLRYYCAALHPALFALPHAVRDKLGARR
jgi:spermidine synthase